MKSILVAVSSALIAYASIAQITITSDDIIDVGDSVQLAEVDSIPPGFGPGPSGPDQHWNFSNLIMDTTTVLRFIEPDSTPYAASFPNSNMAVEGMIEGVEAEGYAYITKNISLFQIDGFGGSYDIFEDIVVPFEPPEVMFDFPVNYLDSSLQTTVMDIRLDSPEPGIDSIRVKITTTVNSRVDAWGEVTTPVWIGQVLRKRDVRHTIDSTWVKFLFIWVFLEANEDIGVAYNYLANDVGYPVLQFNADTSETEFSGINYHIDAGVGTEELIVAEDADFEVYPNPAHGIVYCKMHNAEVEGELTLYDLMGKKITSLRVTSNQQLYSIDILKYPAGMYQVVLLGKKGGLATKKILVR